MAAFKYVPVNEHVNEEREDNKNNETNADGKKYFLLLSSCDTKVGTEGTELHGVLEWLLTYYT